MKNLSYIFSIILLISCACNSDKTPEKEAPAPSVIVPDAVVIEPSEDSNDGSTSVKARFIEFYLGDTEHYIFEDEAGKRWDFAGSQSSKFEFARELDDQEANESNQGWGSNTDLQGKWFKLTYEQREQEQYIDGPIGIVEIISQAMLVEK
ncbi:MAG: hypothetical protein KJP00_10530 [Bacteroidia bacterium]|nr:hypothetical protein [Bacteroidia bacterium]